MARKKVQAGDIRRLSRDSLQKPLERPRDGMLTTSVIDNNPNTEKNNKHNRIAGLSKTSEKLEATLMSTLEGRLHEFWYILSMKYCPLLFCSITLLFARLCTRSQGHYDEKDRPGTYPPRVYGLICLSRI